MRPPFFRVRILIAIAIAACLVSAAQATRLIFDKPYLSNDLQEKLQNLPYGLTGQRALLIRYKHVDSIQFYGGGDQSRFSFKQGRSVLPEGMSLRLIQSGLPGWAEGAIHFKKPLNLARYNSVVVWAWASQPQMRLWVGLSSGGQARSDALPVQGLPPHEPAQLVIPFSRFSPKSKVNLASVTDVLIEFGKDTVGNSPDGAIQILGVAFVEQEQPLSRALIVLGREQAHVTLAEPLTSNAPDETDEFVVAEPNAGGKREQEPSAWSAFTEKVESFVTTSRSEVTGFMHDMGFEFPTGETERSYRSNAPGSGEHPDSEWAERESQTWPAPAKPTTPETHRPPEWFYALFVASLAGLWYALFRRRKKAVELERLGKVIHEIHWPFAITQAVLHKRVEREFWRGVAAHHERFAWLSLSGLLPEKSVPTEYFGEPFLRRQIRLADRVGLRLFPSLAFKTTLVRKSGVSPQFERSAPALTTLITETILRFSDIAPGVRIENASQFFEADNAFWSGIIEEVRAKRPHFIFVADAIGDQARLARDAGFDYYENDRLPSILHAQIKEGRVGDAVAFLRGESAQNLGRSIFNLTPLLKAQGKRDVDRQQDLLCAVLLTLLPGVVQHDATMDEELSAFINRLARSAIVRNGHFMLLKSGSPEILAFARWRKKTLIVAVANFSSDQRTANVSLTPLRQGFDGNKLYLFNNTLHGLPGMRKLLNQPDGGGPALALWGQNLSDSGLPLLMPPLSLGLFSVSLTKPLAQVAPTSEPGEREVAALS